MFRRSFACYCSSSTYTTRSRSAWCRLKQFRLYSQPWATQPRTVPIGLSVVEDIVKYAMMTKEGFVTFDELLAIITETEFNN